MACWLALYEARLEAQEPPQRVAARLLADWAADLKNGDEQERLKAVRTLPVFGRHAADALQDALSDPSPAVRYAAAEAVGNLRLASPERLEELLEDEHVAVRTAAAYARLRHGTHERAFVQLISAVTYNNRTLPLAAIDFLEKLGLEGDLNERQRQEAVMAMDRRINDQDSHIAKAANRSIRSLKREDSNAAGAANEN